jgi:hypothetical protein
LPNNQTNQTTHKLKKKKVIKKKNSYIRLNSVGKKKEKESSLVKQKNRAWDSNEIRNDMRGRGIVESEERTSGVARG